MSKKIEKFKDIKDIYKMSKTTILRCVTDLANEIKLFDFLCEKLTIDRQTLDNAIQEFSSSHSKSTPHPKNEGITVSAKNPSAVKVLNALLKKSEYNGKLEGKLYVFRCTGMEDELEKYMKKFSGKYELVKSGDETEGHETEGDTQVETEGHEEEQPEDTEVEERVETEGHEEEQPVEEETEVEDQPEETEVEEQPVEEEEQPEPEEELPIEEQPVEEQPPVEEEVEDQPETEGHEEEQPVEEEETEGHEEDQPAENQLLVKPKEPKAVKICEHFAKTFGATKRKDGVFAIPEKVQDKFKVLIERNKASCEFLSAAPKSEAPKKSGTLVPKSAAPSKTEVPPKSETPKNAPSKTATTKTTATKTTTPKPPPKKTSTKEPALKKNKWGSLCDPESGLIFDPKTKVVVGYQDDETDDTYGLNEDLVELCKKNGWKYDENMVVEDE